MLFITLCAAFEHGHDIAKIETPVRTPTQPVRFQSAVITPSPYGVDMYVQ